MHAKKILIIEIDHNFGKTTEERLQRIGYWVLYAKDGVDGLQKIYQDKPSIGISIPYDNLTVEQKEILEKTNII